MLRISMHHKNASVDIRRQNTLRKIIHRQMPLIVLIVIGLTVLILSALWVGQAFASEPKPIKMSHQKYEQYINARPANSTTTTTTTTTVPKKVAAVAPPSKAAQPTITVGEGDDIYHKLAQCESGDPTYNGPSGYDGAFQFHPSTWNSMNTGYAFAYEAPFEVQLDAAKRLIARSGWGQFPACARQLNML